MQRLARALPLALLCLAALDAAGAARSRQGSEAQARVNPIRKVVTLLQAMQKKVTEEGEAEKRLYEKFMCYCKKGGSELQASISEAEAKVPAVSSDIEASEGKLVQTKEGLKQSQADRDSAKDAMQEATALREKEASEFAAVKAESDANIAAIKSAVAALEKGMAGSFLQTATAQALRQLVDKANIPEGDRQELASFLSGTAGSDYAPQSGEITGILKQMGATMAKGLADATASEEDAIKGYEALMDAKAKETAALTASVESKTEQIGELGVEIVALKEDLSDTQASLAEDSKFLASMKTSCDTKAAEWEKRSTTRSEELIALADTIKVLNDDDALDLFKKTLPSASASFIQLSQSASAQRARALTSLRTALGAARPSDRAGLDFLVLALTSKRALGRGGFDKVVQMIDSMVEVLKKEQMDDDHKKEYCAAQFDASDDKKKALERTVSDEETAIESAKEGVSKLASEISALETGIVELDKSVAEATEQRKAEHTEFKELMASDSAAKELLGIAKNRLNEFYNPKLYAPAPKRELTREERINVNMGGTAPPTPAPGGIAGTGVTAFTQLSSRTRRDAPAPPPETWDAYAKKSQESTGVISMIDLLIKDLDKEMTEAETEEKDGQADYEVLMKDSKEKRTADSKALANKEAAKADLEGDLEDHKAAKKDAGGELMATLKYISSLHSECDWLMQYFDVRKEARAGEVDSLKNAKAVLSGADYSLF